MLERGLPISLRKRAVSLTNSVRPAFGNDLLSVAIEEATSIWCNSVETALREHYDDTLREALDHIAQDALPEHLLDVSLDMVTKWTRRQLGKKLDDNQLDEAISTIKATQLLLIEDLPTPLATTSAATNVIQPRPSSIRFVNASMQTEPPLSIPPSKMEPHTQRSSTSSFVDMELDASHRTRAPFQRVDLDESSADSDLEPLTPAAATFQEVQPHQPQYSASRNSCLGTGSPLEPAVSQDTEHNDAQPSAAPNRQEPFPAQSTQTTLFGKPAARCLNPNKIDYTKANVVFGDSNLAALSHDNTTVFAPKNGRLSALKSTLLHVSGTYDNVINFFLCLSFLDAGNQPKTNLTVFRAIMYTARKVFPHASLYVLLNALPAGANDDAFSNIVLTNELIVNHKPAGCSVIKPPPRLSSSVTVWDDEFCIGVFNILKERLN